MIWGRLCMQAHGAVAFLLASTLTAAAQESVSSKGNLLDDRLPALMAAEDPEQAKQDETRTVTSDKLQNNLPGGHGDEATSSIEPKLLLGGEIAPSWHWGANFFYERTLNNSVREHGVTASLLHTVVDKVFTAGMTAKFVYESDNIGSSQD